MTRQQALRSYTIWPAFAGFQDDVLGSIEVGKLADLTILDRDILNIPAQEILEADVAYTVVGGEIVYSGSGGE